MNPTNFLTELKRRNVYRAAVAYGVVAWFLTQLTTQVFPFFEIPNSAVRFVVIALAVGFPIAMLLSWVYEFTPEGVVRTEDLNPVQAKSVQRAAGRILDFIIIGALLLVIAMLIVGRLPFYRQTGESISQKSIAVLPFENLCFPFLFANQISCPLKKERTQLLGFCSCQSGRKPRFYLYIPNHYQFAPKSKNFLW